MTLETQVKFTLRRDYYEYGQNDARGGVFDTSYVDRTDDARLSYMAGWSSVSIAERERGAKTRVI